MGDWDFLHDMYNAGYSADDIMEAQGTGLAPWDRIEEEEDYDDEEEDDDIETLEDGLTSELNIYETPYNTQDSTQDSTQYITIKGQTMKWAFVDYENMGTLEDVNVSDYERLFIFCGPHNTKLKFGSLPVSSFCKIELLGIKTTGNNNLDFHLAFHVGRLHETTTSEIEFHVLSNDTGFDGLVQHLNDIGRKCKTIRRKTDTKKEITGKKKAATPKPKESTPKIEIPQLTPEALHLIKRIEHSTENNRPKARDKFLNYIKSQCNGFPNPIEPELLLNELVAHKKIVADGKKISYKIAEKVEAKPKDQSVGALHVIEKLQQLDGRKRPRKKDGLVNWIKSNCKSLTPAIEPVSIFTELVNSKIITTSGTNVIYSKVKQNKQVIAK